jgi:hypothetical protein
MFIDEAKLSLFDISGYWSRVIERPATPNELLRRLERAWWLGQFRGDADRLELLKRMFKSMRHSDDLGIVFIVGEGTGEPPVKKLPDGSVLVDARPRICLPSNDADAWNEGSCNEAFDALARTSSFESYPEIAPGLAFIELTYDEFTSWLESRGYGKPKFWRPLSAKSRLEKPKRGRPAEYNWIGVKRKLVDYVSEHGPVKKQIELMQKCADFAGELHPKGKTPDDKTIRDAIKTHALDIAAGLTSGK